MADAWMVRSGQQQRLIEQFMPQVYNEALEAMNEDDFFMTFLDVVLHTIRVQPRLGIRPDPGVDRAGQLMEKFLIQVNAFARVQAEVSLLLVLLMKKVEVSAFAGIHHAWDHEESSNAPVALRAPSRMADVEVQSEQ